MKSNVSFCIMVSLVLYPDLIDFYPSLLFPVDYGFARTTNTVFKFSLHIIVFLVHVPYMFYSLRIVSLSMTFTATANGKK